MISKFRKDSFKSTAIAIVGIIIVSSAVLTNPVNAEEKGYSDLASLESDADFKFKVPDVLSDNGYKLSSLWLMSNSRIECWFDNSQDSKGFNFDLLISKEDPATYLKEKMEKSVKEIESREPLKLGNIKGENIETKRSFFSEEILTETKKYFVFKIVSIFYAIEYMRYHGDELEHNG